MTLEKHAEILFNGTPLTIEQVAAIAAGAKTRLSDEAAYVRRIDAGAEFVDRWLADGKVIYGVNTGYGDSVTRKVATGLVDDLPARLTDYHGVGLGAHFSAEETRAIVAARLVSLARGYSGVSYALLKQLAALLKHDILPLIPEEGSVGASGDLTPLSYVAAVMGGRREARFNGKVVPAADALAACGLKPYRLRPKEGLAMMNGTAVMTGLACLNFHRAERLEALSTRVSALAALALGAGTAHFEAGLHAVKPFAGQGRAAARIRQDLVEGGRPATGGRLQERYSIRCSPHVIGVLGDSLPFYRGLIEGELNSSNDNPIVDVEAGQVFHGGHFFGGHICHAMDSMKAAVASLADLLDRQVALLVDARYSEGLPSNLSGIHGDDGSVHHGFKALQITASACAAEAQMGTLPASAFSRSTESHNQDKVSLGTIAARGCRRTLQLSEQVAICALVTAAQGVELRRQIGAWPAPSGGPAATLAWVRSMSPAVGEDRALESELRDLLAAWARQEHTPYAGGA
jgi:histidine ammonia-lyase